jgi:hypothetical protein
LKVITGIRDFMERKGLRDVKEIKLSQEPRSRG